MALLLKSVVFKTNDLKRTRDFFMHQLGVSVSESSIEHFVIHWKNIRVLFIYSAVDSSPELYFSQAVSKMETVISHPLTQLTDPNGIKIIIG